MKGGGFNIISRFDLCLELCWSWAGAKI